MSVTSHKSPVVHKQAKAKWTSQTFSWTWQENKLCFPAVPTFPRNLMLQLDSCLALKGSVWGVQGVVLLGEAETHIHLNLTHPIYITSPRSLRDPGLRILPGLHWVLCPGFMLQVAARCSRKSLSFGVSRLDLNPISATYRWDEWASVDPKMLHFVISTRRIIILPIWATSQGECVKPMH